MLLTLSAISMYSLVILFNLNKYSTRSACSKRSAAQINAVRPYFIVVQTHINNNEILNRRELTISFTVTLWSEESTGNKFSTNLMLPHLQAINHKVSPCAFYKWIRMRHIPLYKKWSKNFDHTTNCDSSLSSINMLATSIWSKIHAILKTSNFRLCYKPRNNVV